MVGTHTSTGTSKVATVLRVTSGNFLEMFDFFLFGFYASYISKAFFPVGSEFASLMLTFMTFGAGFLMRPLGAIFLGAYVDRIGRRQGLLTTLGNHGAWHDSHCLRARIRNHWSFRTFACSGRSTTAGLFSRCRARWRFCLSRGNGNAWKQRLLRFVAIREPAGRGDVCRHHRLHPEPDLEPGADGRLGMAHTVLYRLRDRALPVLHPQLAGRDEGVSGKEAPADHPRNLPYPWRESKHRAAGHDDGRDDDRVVLHNHCVYP